MSWRLILCKLYGQQTRTGCDVPLTPLMLVHDCSTDSERIHQLSMLYEANVCLLRNAGIASPALCMVRVLRLVVCKQLAQQRLKRHLKELLKSYASRPAACNAVLEILRSIAAQLSIAVRALSHDPRNAQKTLRLLRNAA